MTAALKPLLDVLRPGMLVYIPGGSGELQCLTRALAETPDAGNGVHFVSCLIPGINRFDYASIHPEARLSTFLLPPPLRASFAEGKVDVRGLSYTEIARYLRGLEPDVAIAHVSEPDAEGACSLGLASDFTPLIWPNAKLRVMVVNRAMPQIRRASRLQSADAHVMIELDDPVLSAEPTETDTVLGRIARSVAALVPDGASVQTGIGGAPLAVWQELRDHRDIVLRSGIATDPLMDLFQSGALARGASHTAGIAYGSERFYRFLAEEDLIAFRPVPRTHGFSGLAGAARFTAINSALEIDLFGQANLEWQSGRLVSGGGGAPDFARAALASDGGRSIVALPSTARGGTISRIVPRLGAPTVSLPGYYADTVVTEHGVAELRGRTIDERADALIGIAAPEQRSELSAAWQAHRRQF